MPLQRWPRAKLRRSPCFSARTLATARRPPGAATNSEALLVSNRDRKKSPYRDLFPHGVSVVITAPLPREIEASKTLEARVEAHSELLKYIERLRGVRTVPEDAVRAHADALRTEAGTSADLELAKTDWLRQYRATYGALLAQFGDRNRAESFFLAVRRLPRAEQDDEAPEAMPAPEPVPNGCHFSTTAFAPLDDNDPPGTVGGNDPTLQARRCLERVRQALAAIGAEMTNVTKSTLLLAQHWDPTFGRGEGGSCSDHQDNDQNGSVDCDPASSSVTRTRSTSSRASSGTTRSGTSGSTGSSPRRRPLCRRSG